jgi:uncharacterized membrane protein SirB2
MTPFEWLKWTHISCAFLSITGFTLRGYWKLTANPRLQRRSAKILPHCIDTLLLGSALGMLVIWQTSPLAFDWLVAKLLALLAYIVLGMIALRFGRQVGTRAAAYILALLSAGYIVSVAYTKEVTGPLGFALG